MRLYSECLYILEKQQINKFLVLLRIYGRWKQVNFEIGMSPLLILPAFKCILIKTYATPSLSSTVLLKANSWVFLYSRKGETSDKVLLVPFPTMSQDLNRLWNKIAKSHILKPIPWLKFRYNISCHIYHLNKHLLLIEYRHLNLASAGAPHVWQAFAILHTTLLLLSS